MHKCINILIVSKLLKFLKFFSSKKKSEKPCVGHSRL